MVVFEILQSKKLISRNTFKKWQKNIEISTLCACIYLYVQGDPNQKLLIQMAITLKICISDPKLVKPKCVLEAYIYFENCKQTAEKSK